SAVVAVIDVSGCSVPMMAQAKSYRSVRLIVVMIFNFDFDAAVSRKVGTIEAVNGERALPAIDEPVRMLDDPFRVDAHVVRHHVAREAYAEMSSAVPQIFVCRVSAKVFGDVVFLERVSRRDSIALSAQALDGSRRDAAFP